VVLVQSQIPKNKNRSAAQDWTGRKVLIIGAARQGLALAGYLVRHGAHVVLNDKRPASELVEALDSLAEIIKGWPGSLQWVFGSHPIGLLNDAELVCISGGVPLTLPLLVEAMNRGIPLSNDSQIFLEARPCKVIGITGSAGKTTTTSLVGRIAGRSQKYNKVWIGGNIGSPLIAVIDQMDADDLAVMELSSFQLDIMNQSPDVAAILNVTPNHLDRHGTMAAYTAAKARILDFQTQSNLAVLGRDDPGAWSLTTHVKGQIFSFGLSPLPADQAGTYCKGDELFLRLPGGADQKLIGRESIQLRGDHNLLNVLAAAAITAAAGLEVECVSLGVSGFGGVAHRLEFVRSWGGAEWYNDSIATTPERTMADIRSFDEPLVLLAGGRDKNLPWDDFARLVHQRVDHLIVFGEAADKIVNAMSAVEIGQHGENLSDQQGDQVESASAARMNGRQRLTITRCSRLVEAVEQAARLVQPGDVVLLSPGGTSFDEFHDFEERGECFTRWVKELP
jgi:UDP-N-acetylmuramoylalanine--D-glutamate ligase